MGSMGGPLLDLCHRLMDGLCDVVDILGGHTAHVDATASHQVDVLLLYEIFDLFGVEAGETEHADLLGDMVPGARRAQCLELGLQLSSHEQHSVRHCLHIVLPADREE